MKYMFNCLKFKCELAISTRKTDICLKYAVMSQKYLNNIAHQIISENDALGEVMIVLPSKRAKVFLLNEIKSLKSEPIFAPTVWSIEEFISEMSGIEKLDAVALLFEFYQVYKNLNPDNSQSFDVFSSWAKTLLTDFNEIDRYLLDANRVFSYLKDIEDLKHWAVDADQQTDMIKNYLYLWEQMPIYYKALHQHFAENNFGYQGYIYRKSVENLADFATRFKKKKWYFAGFNALNQAEEKIFQYFLEEYQARVLWDIDEHFLNDFNHEAGYFARKIKSDWKHYKTHPFEQIVQEFGKEKHFEIIATPKSVGQAKIAGNIIKENKEKGVSTTDMAVILSEEKLLMPMLYALPEDIGDVNITMGYQSRANPVQLLVHSVFKLQVNAHRRNPKQWVFYYQELIDVLENPLLMMLIDAQGVVAKIRKQNYTYITYDTLVAWLPKINEILARWDISVTDITQNIRNIILSLQEKLWAKRDDVTLTFLHSVYQIINQVEFYLVKYKTVKSIEELFEVYKQIVDWAEVSFEGEPLSGLQIMGVLESRTLDFDTLIITSLNEGVFPAGKGEQSFIPYDVKLELGLPTYREKDAIYTYHFYHAIQRAKNIYLIYNSDADGLDAGEPSRFVTQLEMDAHPNHHVRKEQYFAYLPDQANQPFLIEKSGKLQTRLHEMATVKGFSPTALTSYLRNPKDFYFQYVLGINPSEEVEENIALNTLGTVVHNVLESLFTPCVGVILSVDMLEQMKAKIRPEVEKQFHEIYSQSYQKAGKNLLAFEVVVQNITQYLNDEIKLIKQGDEVLITALETKLETVIEDKKLPFPVKLIGYVDRIEKRNNKTRIIDYKTGRVEAREVGVNFGEFVTEKKSKAMQLLAYALMYQNADNEVVEVANYSFKNQQSGYLLFALKEKTKVITETVSTEVLEQFKTELVDLLSEILDEKTVFKEKIN